MINAMHAHNAMVSEQGDKTFMHLNGVVMQVLLARGWRATRAGHHRTPRGARAATAAPGMAGGCGIQGAGASLYSIRQERQ